MTLFFNYFCVFFLVALTRVDCVPSKKSLQALANDLKSPEVVKGVISPKEFQTIGSTFVTTTKIFYAYVGTPVLELTWLESIEYCQQRNMSLARIDTSSENALLTDALNSQLEYSHFWIAGTDLQTEGRWFWFGDVREMRYRNWGANEPDDGPTENCMTLYEDGFWHSHQCTDTWAPLCQTVS